MPPRGRMAVGKPKDAKNTFLRVLAYLKPYRRLLPIVALCIIVSSLSGVVGTYLLKPILNEYIVPFIGGSQVDLSGFAGMLLALLGIYAAGALCSYAYSRIMINVSTGTLNRIRKDLFDHMQDLPIRYFDTHTHGELMSLFTNDTDTMRELLSQALPQIFTSVLTIISVFVMMLTLSPLLVLLLLVTLGVILLIIKTVGKKSRKYFGAMQKEVATVNGYIEELITGQRVVKVFCHEDASIEQFDKLNENLRREATGAHTCANIMGPVTNNMSHIHYAITAAVGAAMIIAGRLDIGSLTAFLSYTRNFFNPITQLSQLFNTIMLSLAGAERIFKALDEAKETDEGYVELVNARRDENGALKEVAEHTGLWAWKHPHHDGTTTYTQLQGDVVFENVTFSYVPGKVVLSDVSLYAKPGQKIAFVGSTGAGKTTITNLLNRFYDIDSGRITIDGIDIKQLPRDMLRKNIAMVLQDTHLFTGTIMENIRYGRLDATDEEVIAAAKTASADSFIRRLSDGYNTMIEGDGANLSQGQRQLLNIARAAISKAPILVLDEATSSVDTRTERHIEHGMDRLMQERTTFVIAHRLSTVRNANAIMVLENGEIIERGDHDDLLAMKGRYYELYTGKSELT